MRPIGIEVLFRSGVPRNNIFKMFILYFYIHYMWPSSGGIYIYLNLRSYCAINYKLVVIIQIIIVVVVAPQPFIWTGCFFFPFFFIYTAGLLGWGSALHKASTYTQDNTDMHA
jgi:hypothetical protein